MDTGFGMLACPELVSMCPSTGCRLENYPLGRKKKKQPNKPPKKSLPQNQSLLSPHPTPNLLGELRAWEQLTAN